MNTFFKIVVLLSFLKPLVVSAQYDEDYSFSKKKDIQLEDKKEDVQVNRTTPETSFGYIKSGFSVGSLLGENQQFVPAALGTRQYADEFYYGAEISTHTADEIRTTLTKVQFGHHFLTWRHRVKPYVGGMFGYANVKDTSDQKRISTNGISYGLDLGFSIVRSGPFAVNTGITFQKVSHSKKDIQDSSFQDIYLMFGVNF